MSVRVSTDVWENSTHGGTELLVLLKMADNADEATRIAWPSVAYLAKRCRVGDRTVRYALAALRKSGEITVVKHSVMHSPTTYRIGCEDLQTLPPLPEDAGPDMQPHAGKPSVEPSVENTYTSGRQKPAPLTEEIHRVFDHWRERCGHRGAKLTADRRLKVAARLREGYSVEQIKLGIDNAASHAYVNTEGRRFDDLELICRSGSKLEDFMRRGSGIDRTSVADFLKR